MGEVQGAEAVIGDPSQHALRSRGGESVAEEVVRREEFNNLILTLNTRNANIIGGKSTERWVYLY